MAVSSKKSSKIFVIFCGGSGSGKTTLVDMVEKSLTEKYNVITLSLDDYYLVNRKSRNFDTPAAFDWTLAKKVVNSLLKGNKEVKIPKYNFKNHTRQYKTISAANVDIIILEGIMSMYDKTLKDLAALKIYVDVSDDERLCRRILRDMEQRGTDVVKTIEMWRKHVIHSHHMYVEPHKFECDLDIPWNREKLLAVNAIVGGIEYEYFKSKNNSTK